MKICIIEHGDTKSYRITANGHTITCNRGTVDAALAQATKESR